MDSFERWASRQLEDAPQRAQELMRLQQLDAANRAQIHRLEQGEPGVEPAPRRRRWWEFWKKELPDE